MNSTPIVINILTDLTSISSLVNKFFKDEEKTTIWLNTQNPLLGGQEPIEMIYAGKTEELYTFIKSRYEL